MRKGENGLYKMVTPACSRVCMVMPVHNTISISVPGLCSDDARLGTFVLPSTHESDLAQYFSPFINQNSLCELRAKARQITSSTPFSSLCEERSSRSKAMYNNPKPL